MSNKLKSGQPVGKTSAPAFASVTVSPYIYLVAVFASLLLISNIVATKGVVLFPSLNFELGPIVVDGLITDGAFWLFPLAYIIGDVISEVYGFKAMRRAIGIGFAVTILAALAFTIAIELPAAFFYENQEALQATVGQVPQILLASLAGYIIGELLNSFVLVKMKERSGEKGLFARLFGSTVVGEFADTLIFCSIAAPVIGITTGGDFLNFVIVGFVWKTLVELLVMPLTIALIKWIKSVEPSYQTSS